jgi:lipid II:glycine glycyltransferase (peptidoglycan interpeptide bridge formation enzyme)
MLHVAQESDTEWDAALDKTIIWRNDHDLVGAWNPYHYSGWARVRAIDGWQSLRVVDDEGQPIAQVLAKRIGLVTAAYCPGGFVRNQAVGANAVKKFLQHELDSRALYVRVHCLTPTQLGDACMELSGWSQSSTILSSGQSLQLRLDIPLDQRLANLSVNWRRNLRRAEHRENHVTIIEQPSAQEIAHLHESLELTKGRRLSTWGSSTAHVQALLDGFGNRLIVARCVSDQGDLRALRGAIITGGCAYDILASSSTEGRKHYSSHLTLWTLINELSVRGVTRYDLGGVDTQRNLGVYNFKNGTGATPISYGGEYDSALPSLIRSTLSRLVAFRSVI